jgi:hypothetical protein
MFVSSCFVLFGWLFVRQIQSDTVGTFDTVFSPEFGFEETSET